MHASQVEETYYILCEGVYGLEGADSHEPLLESSPSIPGVWLHFDNGNL